MINLVAVAFGADGFTGDSCFYPGQFILEITGNETLEQLIEQYVSLPDNEERSVPVGFWILAAEHLDIAQEAFAAGDESESATYAANRAVKRICHRLSVRIIGDASVLEKTM